MTQVTKSVKKGQNVYKYQYIKEVSGYNITKLMYCLS